MHSRFSSLALEIFTVSILAGLLLYNIVVFFKYEVMIALLPIAVQTTLMFFFVTRHKYLAPAIKIWSVVIIVSGGFGLLNALLGEMDTDKMLWSAIRLVIGLMLYVIASREIEIVSTQDDSLKS